MLSLFTILANVAALLLCLALGSAQARPGWGLSRRAAAAEPARPVTGARYAYPVARRQKRQDQPAGDCPPFPLPSGRCRQECAANETPQINGSCACQAPFSVGDNGVCGLPQGAYCMTGDSECQYSCEVRQFNCPTDSLDSLVCELTDGVCSGGGGE